MRRVFKHGVGQIDGVLDATHPRHCSGIEQATFHDGSVKFDITGMIKYRTVPGVKQRRVFHDIDGSDHRVATVPAF